MPIVASMGASVSVVDFDRDGWPDIFVTSGQRGARTASTATCTTAPSRTWPRRSASPISIRKAPASAWVPSGATSTTTATRTCSSTSGAGPILFHNDKGKDFTPRHAEKSGLPDWINANSAVWLDLRPRRQTRPVHRRLLARRPRPVASDTTPRSCPRASSTPTNGGRKHLLHNNGDGTFEDVTKKMGIEEHALDAGRRRRRRCAEPATPTCSWPTTMASRNCTPIAEGKSLTRSARRSASPGPPQERHERLASAT